MDISTEDIEAAIEDVRNILRLDGADLIVTKDDGGRVTMTLDLDGVECLDCVMTAAHIEAIIRAHVSERLGRGLEFELEDPRAGAR